MDTGLRAGVREIIEARRAVRVLPDLAGDHAPRTLSDGYLMQEAFTAEWNDRLVGWKVGATSKQVQELFGVSEPIYAPVFGRDVFRSPARLRARAFHHCMLESEFAFRFGTDLPPRATPFTRAEIVAAVDALQPAIEIISPRFDRLTVDRIPQLVADCGGNGGAILGLPREDWRELDLPNLGVALSIGGALRQAGTGAAVLGSPLHVLEWFVETFRSQGRGVAAGSFVMTGTMTGIHGAAPGETAVADYGPLGRVEVTFAGDA